MRRRDFITSVAKTAAICAYCGVPYGLSFLLAPQINAAPHTRIPLPGALSDRESFSEACLRCGACGEVCPPSCIQFHLSDAGNQAKTPFINPEEKACTLCGKCMEVCPTNALTVTPPREIRMGIAQIDRAACYPWVDKGICGACVSACPIGDKAISFDFGNIYRPVVQEECVGCGQCVEVCPHPSLPIRIVGVSQSKITLH